MTIRVDKWLWHARFFKTRSRAAKLVSDGRLRLNAERVSKSSTLVGAGDTLTFPQGRVIRVVRVVAPGTRRGPAAEAEALYEDLTPEQENVPPAPSYEGKGRPTKKERRAIDPFRRSSLD